MRSNLFRLLNLREGEWNLVVSLFFVLAVNTIVLELSDVVATTGFISSLGAEQVPWLWIVDMIAVLAMASVLSLAIDRLPRLQFLSWIIVGLAAFYLFLSIMFLYRLPDWVTYPILYIVSDLQFMLFPVVFWTLVNDVYDISQDKRLVPLIGVGAALGSMVGNVLPALSTLLLADRATDIKILLFAMAIGLLMVSLVILRRAFRKREIRARKSSKHEFHVRDTINVGIDYFAKLPLFRYLGISMLLVGVALTIIEFHFLYMMQLSFAGNPLIVGFYGIYKVALVLAQLAIQGLVTGRLLQKFPIKNTFSVLPSTLLGASCLALIVPGLVGAAIARFGARLAERAWDEPMRNAILNLIPDERRGRASTFLGTYFFAVATIVGSVILLVLLQVGGETSASETVIAYLLLAAVVSAGAIWATIQARAAYDTSLLNWRLTRPRRRSALDGIDF